MSPLPLGTSSSKDATGASRLFLWFFLVLLIFSLYLLYNVMRPFLHSIILSCVFSALCYPIYKKVLVVFKNRSVLAALVMVVATAILVAGPVAVFIATLIPQTAASISSVNQWLAGQHLGDFISLHLDPLLQSIDQHFPEFEITTLDIRENLLSLSRTTGQNLLGIGTNLVGNTVRIIMHFLLILVMMFYLFMNGVGVVKNVKYLFPLKPEQTSVIIESLRKMARSVFLGGLLVATLQGIVGGIGLSIVGISGIFWGTVMAFAALVPVIGTGLIWVPATIYLYLVDRTGSALFLVLWCGILVAGIDSLLRPFLMKEGAKVPVVFLFLSILGGVQAFGMLGLLYGPMILGLVAVMLTIYTEEFYDILSNRDSILGAD